MTRSQKAASGRRHLRPAKLQPAPHAPRRPCYLRVCCASNVPLLERDAIKSSDQLLVSRSGGYSFAQVGRRKRRANRRGQARSCSFASAHSVVSGDPSIRNKWLWCPKAAGFRRCRCISPTRGLVSRRSGMSIWGRTRPLLVDCHNRTFRKLTLCHVCSGSHLRRPTAQRQHADSAGGSVPLHPLPGLGPLPIRRHSSVPGTTPQADRQAGRS